MAKIEAKLPALGLALLPRFKPPPGIVRPFHFVRLAGNRALFSDHQDQP